MEARVGCPKGSKIEREKENRIKKINKAALLKLFIVLAKCDNTATN